jgi:hypothetical protein
LRQQALTFLPSRRPWPCYPALPHPKSRPSLRQARNGAGRTGAAGGGMPGIEKLEMPGANALAMDWVIA